MRFTLGLVCPILVVCFAAPSLWADVDSLVWEKEGHVTKPPGQPSPPYPPAIITESPLEEESYGYSDLYVAHNENHTHLCRVEVQQHRPECVLPERWNDPPVVNSRTLEASPDGQEVSLFVSVRKTQVVPFFWSTEFVPEEVSGGGSTWFLASYEVENPSGPSWLGTAAYVQYWEIGLPAFPCR